MARRRIGILTGGGDVPGLNSVIKGVVYRGTENDCEVVGIRRGWEGLTHLNLDDPASRERYVLPLSRENTRTIDRYGGTILHSTRTNPGKMRVLPDFLAGATFPQTGNTWDMSSQVLKNLEKLNIDYLISIGGDDTLSYAARLDQLGVKVIAIPKTMDNDVQNTEYCIGFSTAITRATAAIGRQRTTVGSHERIGIFRIFGRDAGFTALYTAYVTSIRCCIPEFEIKLEKVIDLLLTEKADTPSNYVLLVISEGARWEGYQVQEYGDADAFGHRKKMSVGEALASEISKRTYGRKHRQRSDLRSAQRRAGFRGQNDRLHLREHGARGHARRAERGDGGAGRRMLPDGADSRSQARSAQSGRRIMYNTDRYRPSYKNKSGMPIFLTRA